MPLLFVPRGEVQTGAPCFAKGRVPQAGFMSYTRSLVAIWRWAQLRSPLEVALLVTLDLGERNHQKGACILLHPQMPRYTYFNIRRYRDAAVLSMCVSVYRLYGHACTYTPQQTLWAYGRTYRCIYMYIHTHAHLHVMYVHIHIYIYTYTYRYIYI